MTEHMQGSKDLPTGERMATLAGAAVDAMTHQLKYPTVGANRDLNVIFPIERLRELVAEGSVGRLTADFFSFIGYNMDPERLERTLAEEIAEVVVADAADIALLAPA